MGKFITRIGPSTIDIPVIVYFEYFGPTIGWGVKLNGLFSIHFREENGKWVPRFHRLPSWITMAELDILRDMLVEALDTAEKVPSLTVVK